MTTRTVVPLSPAAADLESEEENKRRRLQREKNQAAIDLLDAMLGETDPEVIREQRETLEYLMVALDRHRARLTTPADPEAERRLQFAKNEELRALLRSWRETTDPEEIQDQRETGELLKRVLGEDDAYRERFS